MPETFTLTMRDNLYMYNMLWLERMVLLDILYNRKLLWSTEKYIYPKTYFININNVMKTSLKSMVTPHSVYSLYLVYAKHILKTENNESQMIVFYLHFTISLEGR